MNRLYIDANSIIYLVETGNPFYESVLGRVRAHRATPESWIVTSRLSRLECRIRPLRENNATVLADYEEFFAADDVIVHDVTSDVIERATDLRVRYGFKTPDAIHLATAIEEHADMFLTGDVSLEKCRELKVEVVAGGS